jgi:hypothetical protein
MTLFITGQTAITPGALDLLNRVNINPFTLLERHMKGDFGNVGHYKDAIIPDNPEENPPEDGLSVNALVIKQKQGHVLSQYKVEDCGETVEVWVSTHIYDFHQTTIYLPEED